MVWLGLALLIAATYGALAIQQAYSGPYVVQDDARQHVFWMERFVNPDAFPNDLIADYFQSVAPYGYSALYWLAAKAGIHPLDFNKILPLLIGLLVTLFAFGVALRLYPAPLAAFVVTVLLNQSLWLRDDLVSGTPRAFAVLLLLAFLYFYMCRSLRGCLVALFLQGMFYPHTVLIALGVLGLGILGWGKWRPRLSVQSVDYRYLAAGLAVATLVLTPYLTVKTTEFGPTVNAAQAHTMPEFQPEGRSYFFTDDAEKFWFTGKRSGMFPRMNLNNALMWLWLFLPLLLRKSRHLSPLSHASHERRGIASFVLASGAMFYVAHLLLFQLHLPSRYMEHTWIVALNLLGGIALVLLVEKLLHPSDRQYNWRLILNRGLILILAVFLLGYPGVRLLKGKDFPNSNYVVGQHVELYKFFAAQPKDIVVASLSGHASMLPTFSGRSVLVAREYGIPYQMGYYREFSERTRDLIRAQYSPDIKELKTFIRRYQISFLMLDRGALTPGYLMHNAWVWQYQPEAGRVARALKHGQRPVVGDLLEVCSVFQEEDLLVLSASCLLAAS
jgi:hypothetical protein